MYQKKFLKIECFQILCVKTYYTQSYYTRNMYIYLSSLCHF